MYERKETNRTRMDHAITLTEYYLKARTRPLNLILIAILGSVVPLGVYLVMNKLLIDTPATNISERVEIRVLFVIWIALAVCFIGTLISRIISILCLIGLHFHMKITNAHKEKRNISLNDISFMFRLWTNVFLRYFIEFVIFMTFIPLLVHEMDSISARMSQYGGNILISRLDHQLNIITAIVVYCIFVVFSLFMVNKSRGMFRCDIPDPYISIVITEYNYLMNYKSSDGGNLEMLPNIIVTCDVTGSVIENSELKYPLLNFYSDIYDGHIITNDTPFDIVKRSLYPSYVISKDAESSNLNKGFTEPLYHDFVEYLKENGEDDLYDGSGLCDSVVLSTLSYFCMSVAISNYLNISKGERCGTYYIGDIFNENGSPRKWLLERVSGGYIKFCFDHKPSKSECNRVTHVISKIPTNIISTSIVNKNSYVKDSMIVKKDKRVLTKEIYTISVLLSRKGSEREDSGND